MPASESLWRATSGWLQLRSPAGRRCVNALWISWDDTPLVSQTMQDESATCLRMAPPLILICRRAQGSRGFIRFLMLWCKANLHWQCFVTLTWLTIFQNSKLCKLYFSEIVHRNTQLWISAFCEVMSGNDFSLILKLVNFTFQRANEASVSAKRSVLAEETVF